MRSAQLWCFGVLIPLTLALSSRPAGAFDPIENFIVAADSVATAAGDQAGGGQALAEYISRNGILIGAAAGQLSDIALELEVAGEAQAAQENLDFAERIATLHREATGSTVPLDLVMTYRDWTAGQKAVRQEAKALEAAAVEARNAGEYDRAIDLFDQAMALYDSIGDARSTAILWGSLGVACWYKGDFDAVAGHYENALAARRAVEDRILEGRTLNGLGSVNYQLGNLDLAREYYMQAIDLRRKTGDLVGLATSLTYLGNIYLAIGRMVEARTTYEQAVPVVAAAGDGTRQFELLISVASLNAEMGRMTSANSTLREGLDLARRMEDPRGQALCHLNLALNHAEAFSYSAALENLDAAREILSAHPDPELSVVYFRNSGITNMKMGELEWAQSDFDTLLELSQTHQLPAYQLEALLNLGYLLKEEHEYEKGLWYAEDARDLAEEMESPKMLREAMVLKAELEHWLTDYDTAIQTWVALLEQDREAGIDANIAMDLMGVANNQVIAGRSEAARKTLRELAPIVGNTGDGDLILAQAFAVGHSFEETDPDSARLYYEIALDMLDQTRSDIGGTEVRTGYFGGLRRFYFEEVAMYYAGLARGDDAAEWSGRAFETIERAKARGLLDLIEAPMLASGSAAEDALLDSLYRLDPDQPGYSPRKRALEERYESLRNQRLEAAHGGGMRSVTMATSDAVLDELPDDTALLAYALGDTASLLWVFDRGRCAVYHLSERGVFEDAVARLREAMTEPMIADADLRQAAHELYREAIAPAAMDISGSEHLMVVPDGVLFELPFEVLLSEPAASGTAWKDLSYLAKSHSITYVPSASIYLALKGAEEGEATAGNTGGEGGQGTHESMSRDSGKRREGSFDRELLALGAPDYSLLQPLPGYGGDITPLPYSVDEVMSVSSGLGDDEKVVLLGRDANEARFKREIRTGSVRVAHLATHGIIDPAEPISSCIVLCPDAEGTEDGYFQTLEVMSQPMDVGLVVLSACESARGQIGRGEGVVGLSRAFLASGTRGLVASLWAVSDESTARLMESFYRRMFEDEEPAGVALNEARLEMMNEDRFAHPYHWSAFVVIGLEDAPW